MGFSMDPVYYLIKSLELDPHNLEAAHLYAKILIDNGKALKAIEFLKSLLVRVGDQPNLQNILALANLKINKYEEAEVCINLALSACPRSEKFLHTAFLVKKAKGDKISAQHYLERIIRNGNESYEMFWEMAKLMDDKSELKKRINILEITFSLNSKDPKIYEELILSYNKWFTSEPVQTKDEYLKKAFSQHIQNKRFSSLPAELKKKINSVRKSL